MFCRLPKKAERMIPCGKSVQNVNERMNNYIKLRLKLIFYRNEVFQIEVEYVHIETQTSSTGRKHSVTNQVRSK